MMFKSVENLVVLLCVAIHHLDCASACRITDKQIDKLTASTDAKPTVQFTGRYRLVSSSCFDEFLKELGVGIFKRGIASRVKPDFEITKSGDKYTLKVLTSLISYEIKFKLNGEQFRETRMDGEDVMATISQSGNKWIHKQFGDQNVLIVREFSENAVTVTAIVNNIASVKVYNRL